MKLSQSRAYIVNDDGTVVAATDVWAEIERLRALLRDFDWDETGTPTAWPNRERIDAALREEGEKS